jgi:NAD(P)-dependent dehydrogenase (short-subunit alcohol dehydrogenase family)
MTRRELQPIVRASITQRSKPMSIVIITGASRGIGASTAIQAGRRGMGVIVTSNHNT